MLLGLIGKANVGKSTFFNSATDLNVQCGNYPFTTI
ncbi:MAG: 50S ribosome-binding GTPase, partial [Thermoproteota archaeon]|nr:50S ribosome-binding GTPase [Thermoproteota archaeon]